MQSLEEFTLQPNVNEWLMIYMEPIFKLILNYVSQLRVFFFVDKFQLQV
jgi:hypothetical protein